MKKLVMGLMVMLLLLFCSSAMAGMVTLNWEASPSSNVVGYKVYYGNTAYASSLTQYKGTDSSLGESPIDVGNVLTTSMEFTPAVPTKYYFTVVAYDAMGNLSVLSNVVNKQVTSVEPPLNVTIE